MVPDQNDALMRALLAPARALEPSEEEIANVLARVRSGARRPLTPRPTADWLRPMAGGLAALLLVAAAIWSVPATRAALEGAGESAGDAFSGWLGGDSADAPGRPLRSDEPAPAEPTPAYLYDHQSAKEPRVIAEAGGYKLYSYIGSSGGLNFLLGGGLGFGFENIAELGEAPLHVLGPGARQHADAEGHVPLFGIAAEEVAAVELIYASGPPLRVEDIEGGFVLLAEPSREPREVVAYDGDGKVLGRKAIGYIDWAHYVR